jgi:predicted transcriptional regulator
VRKTLKVGVMSFDALKARTQAVARGELRPQPGDPKIWFSSLESLAKVLSSRNRALLSLISEARPASIKELAELSGRATPNLSRTLKTFERYGLVRLAKGARGAVRPEAVAQRVEFMIPLTD